MDTQPAIEPDSVTMPVETKKRGRRPGKRDGADYKRIVAIAKKNPDIPKREIARQVGVDKATVNRALAKYGINQQEVAEYVENRVAIFQGLQRRLIASLTDEDIAKMSGKDRLLGLGIVYDKERLETGKSTSNISSISRFADQLDATDNPPDR